MLQIELSCKWTIFYFALPSKVFRTPSQISVQPEIVYIIFFYDYKFVTVSVTARLGIRVLMSFFFVIHSFHNSNNSKKLLVCVHVHMYICVCIT